MIYDVVIVGGGVSGLFLGAFLKDLNFIILEKNKKVGRKLLLSGAGQCNFTHGGDILEFSDSYGSNYKFIKDTLRFFDNKDLVNYLESKGLKTFEREDKKIFPKSMKASDLLSLLLDEIRRNKGIIKTDSQVIEVKKIDEVFEVKTKDQVYLCKNLVISTGGNSYQNTGSTGDGYQMAKSFGHTIEEIRPALAPVKIKDYKFDFMSGVSIKDAYLDLYREDKKQGSFKGDILFTHKGLSGPIIINNSRYFKEGDLLRVSLVSNMDREEFARELQEKIQLKGKSKLKSILKSFAIPQRLLDFIIENYIEFFDKNSSEISKKERQRVVSLISQWEFEISLVGGYHIAMATKGGVCLNEINKKTLESKLVKNLYFAGEVIDIDADTGGYNIQACASMAKKISTKFIEKV